MTYPLPAGRTSGEVMTVPGSTQGGSVGIASWTSLHCPIAVKVTSGTLGVAPSPDE